jgi:GGDEF domain-containing protein
VRDMIRHGASYSSAQWASRLADLVNPLVVGTFLGATGVGYVAFAQRLVDTIAFAKRGAYRLGMVAMSRVADEEKGRLRYSIEEGSLLQLLSLAVPIACFGVLARWVVPTIFGHEWAKAVPLYSILALASVLSAPLFIQTTFLFSRGRNIAVSGIALVQSICIAGAAVVLVRHFGLDGFGEAWLFGTVAVFFSDRVVRRAFPFSYRRIVPWLFILGPPVLFPLAPLPWAFLLLSPLLLVLAPPLRAEVVRITVFLRSALARRTRATVTDAALVGTAQDPACGEATIDGGRGGVDRLLWMARTHCGAAVAFASVRHGDGRFSSIAFPGTAAGSAWSEEALGELVAGTWSDLERAGGSVVRDAIIANPEPGEPGRQVSVAAAPLADPGGHSPPWGILGVVGPTGGRFERSQLELLGNLAQRLTAFLRARDRLTAPAPVIAGSAPGTPVGREPAAPVTPMTSELDVLLGPDPLTGLATLTALVGRLSSSLASLRTNDGSVGLILIEVAEANGWQLPSSTTLIDVAGRLTRHLRERDLIARIGPTTFAILVDLLPGPVDVAAIRDRALRSLCGGLATSAGELRTRSGVAWATTGARTTAEHLLRTAAAEMRTQESDRVPAGAPAGAAQAVGQ